MRIYSALRPALFALSPECAHRAAIHALRMGLGVRSHFTHPSLATRIGALELPNPVGLAAGFDKNAECYAGALAAGFGFVEIGTVTPRAQPGNPRPRLFRLVEDAAVINRLGFNNEGAAAAAKNLTARNSGIIGGNIGKNKETEDALADYIAAMRVLYPHVDYITANISSPNTPGLRDLQAGDALRDLVRGLYTARAELEACHPGEGRDPCEKNMHVDPGLRRDDTIGKPMFIKIAPDNDDAALAAIADVALSENIDTLIVSNTTISRPALRSAHAHEQGGLSGKPLMEKSTATLAKMHQLTGGKIPLIGVGGISSAEDAYEKIRAGASAVQLYTALVYQGFGLVESINRGLVKLLERDGFTTVAEAVGKSAE